MVKKVTERIIVSAKSQQATHSSQVLALVTEHFPFIHNLLCNSLRFTYSSQVQSMTLCSLQDTSDNSVWSNGCMEETILATEFLYNQFACHTTTAASQPAGLVWHHDPYVRWVWDSCSCSVRWDFLCPPQNHQWLSLVLHSTYPQPGTYYCSLPVSLRCNTPIQRSFIHHIMSPVVLCYTKTVSG